MKQIGFMFYKAAIDGHVIDNAISIWTKLLALARLDFRSLKYNYSHVEALFVNRGLCFSSTMRDDAQGVRFAPATDVLSHPDRWDCIMIWVTDEEEQYLFDKATGEVGKPYDKLGLFTGFFILAWYFQNDKKRYCSDIIAWLVWLLAENRRMRGVLEWYSWFKKRQWIISPRRLAKILVKNFGELKPYNMGLLKMAAESIKPLTNEQIWGEAIPKPPSLPLDYCPYEKSKCAYWDTEQECGIKGRCRVVLAREIAEIVITFLLED